MITCWFQNELKSATGVAKSKRLYPAKNSVPSAHWRGENVHIVIDQCHKNITEWIGGDAIRVSEKLKGSVLFGISVSISQMNL